MGLTDMVDDARLGLEFAWTDWADSRRDWHTIAQCCRRPSGHEGNHASGFAEGRRQWFQDVPPG